MKKGVLVLYGWEATSEHKPDREADHRSTVWGQDCGAVKNGEKGPIGKSSG